MSVLVCAQHARNALRFQFELYMPDTNAPSTRHAPNVKTYSYILVYMDMLLNENSTENSKVLSLLKENQFMGFIFVVHC